MNKKISMNGKKLEEKAWDIKESISEKSGYYGIIDTNDGIEICFGKKNFELTSLYVFLIIMLVTVIWQYSLLLW